MGLSHIPKYRRKKSPRNTRTPEPKAVCSLFTRCEGCPYPNHGFICWSRDGRCMREIMKKLNEGVDQDAGTSNAE